MAKIDFGPSAYAQHSSDVPRDEMETYGVVEIPETGKLDSFPECEITSKELDSRLTHVGSEEAVIVTISSGGGYINSAYLIYSNERKEWIAIIQNSWHESSAWGWDDSYSRPYAINNRLAEEIAKVYNFSLDETTPEEIIRMPPEMMKNENK